MHEGFLTRCVNYLKQVITLAKRVTWPNRRATVTTTIAVMVMVTITCIFFLAVDQLIGLGLHTLFQIGG
ncbi:preprotein translocase subunit SecE [Acetobacteraceae bacterium]|nr:preprotein translocase subunit SecE [Acetobacteraceae bacterium]